MNIKIILMASFGVLFSALILFFVSDVGKGSKRDPKIVKSYDSFDLVKSDMEGYNEIVFKPVEYTEKEKEERKIWKQEKANAKKERLDYYYSILGNYRVDFSTKKDIEGTIFEDTLVNHMPDATFVRDLYHKNVFISPLSANDIAGMVKNIVEDESENKTDNLKDKLSIQLPFLSEDGEYKYVIVGNCEEYINDNRTLDCDKNNIDMTVVVNRHLRKGEPLIEIRTDYGNDTMPRTLYFMHKGSNEILMFNYLAIDEGLISKNINGVINGGEVDAKNLITTPIPKKIFNHEENNVIDDGSDIMNHILSR